MRYVTHGAASPAIGPGADRRGAKIVAIASFTLFGALLFLLVVGLLFFNVIDGASR